MSLSVTGSLKKTLWQKVGAIIAPNEAMNYKDYAPRWGLEIKSAELN